MKTAPSTRKSVVLPESKSFSRQQVTAMQSRRDDPTHVAETSRNCPAAARSFLTILLYALSMSAA